jgi:hypothetical protein
MLAGTAADPPGGRPIVMPAGTVPTSPGVRPIVMPVISTQLVGTGNLVGRV